MNSDLGYFCYEICTIMRAIYTNVSESLHNFLERWQCRKVDVSM